MILDELLLLNSRKARIERAMLALLPDALRDLRHSGGMRDEIWTRAVEASVGAAEEIVDEIDRRFP
jgi:hypothetical protein